MSKSNWWTGLTEEEIDALPPIGWVTIKAPVDYAIYGAGPQYQAEPPFEVGVRYPVLARCPGGFTMYAKNSLGHRVSVNARRHTHGLEDQS